MQKLLLMLAIILCTSSLALAEEESSRTLAQANNPLANIKTLNFHNYYLPSLYGADDASVNQMFIRYAQPIGRVLIRASLPITTISDGNGHYDSGVGNFNIFGSYLLTDPSESSQFGVGPMLSAPAGKSSLGTERWQAGLAAVAFIANNPKLQYGGLVTWQTDFAGNGNDKTNVMNVQPFVILQLGGGTYLRSSAVWTFDFENGGTNIPFGLGIGRITRIDKMVFNLFAEAQYTVFNDNFAGSKYQIFAGINTQF
ncbi:MAG: hypothetical protein FWC61_02025 [Proteobacteria bacterium]|nr:hypothetical protein [Pseudomonadota bacterium]